MGARELLHVEEYVYNLGMKRDFENKIPKIQTVKKKIDKCDHIKV